MNDTSFPFFLPNNPFLGFGVASYDTLSGIRPGQNWCFSGSLWEGVHKDCFRMCLSSIPRQPEEYVNDYPVSYFDVRDSGYCVFVSYFSIIVEDRPVFYCFAMAVYPKNVKTNSYFIDSVYQQISLLTMRIHKIIEFNSTVKLNESDIHDSIVILYEIMCANMSKPSPPKYTISPQFVSAALTSHLQTQMTTIIEVKTYEEAESLFNFLGCFLFENQIEMSSKTIRSHPVPGLFLQIVCIHQELPYEYLWQFQRPWTWIRMSQQQVIQSPEIDTQKGVFKEFRSCVQMRYNEEIISCKSKMQKTYRPKFILSNKWSLSIIEQFNKTPHQIRTYFCEQQLGHYMRIACVMIEKINASMKNSNSPFLSQENAQQIEHQLNLTDKEESKAIVAIAQLFDGLAFKRMYAGRKEVFMQMIATI